MAGNERDRFRIGANKWYKNDPRNANSLSNDQVYSIYRDRKGRMWLGTFGGGLNLAIKTADGYQFKHFLQDNYGEKRIRVIEEDKNGRIVGRHEQRYLYLPSGFTDCITQELRDLQSCQRHIPQQRDPLFDER